MTRDYANGWACANCLMLLANGETPPELGEEETAEYLSRIEDSGEVTLGLIYGEGGCEHSSEDNDGHEYCERQEFSWSRCDLCGSTLGGERHAVTFWLD